MFCTAKHRPILKCGKNIASILMKTQATSSTSKLLVLPLEPAITTGCQLRSSDCHNGKWRCLKGAVLTSNSAHFTFLLELFSPLSDMTTPLMRLWFSGSMKVISEGNTALCKQIFFFFFHFRFVVSSYLRFKYS